MLTARWSPRWSKRALWHALPAVGVRPSAPRRNSPPATIPKRGQDGRTMLSSYEAGGGVAGAELSIRTLVLLLSVLNTW